MKTTKLKVVEYNHYKEEWEPDYITTIVEVPQNQDTCEELLKWTPEALREFVKEHTVGITSVIGDNKYCKCINLKSMPLRLSLQVHYYVWKIRNREFYDKSNHIWGKERDKLESEIYGRPISEIEFNEAVPTTSTWIDVSITYNNSRVTLGQMSFDDISDFLKDLALKEEVTIDAEC